MEEEVGTERCMNNEAMSCFSFGLETAAYTSQQVANWIHVKCVPALMYILGFFSSSCQGDSHKDRLWALLHDYWFSYLGETPCGKRFWDWLVGIFLSHIGILDRHNTKNLRKGVKYQNWTVRKRRLSDEYLCSVNHCLWSPGRRHMCIHQSCLHR